MTSADRGVTPGNVADAPEDSAPAPVYSWCHPGQHYSAEAVLCYIVEAGSGPGHGLNACPPHMKAKGWRPLADQPIRTL